MHPDLRHCPSAASIVSQLLCHQLLVITRHGRSIFGRRALLWSPYVIGQTIIFSSCFFLYFFLSFFFLFHRLISAVRDWMSIPYFNTWCGLSANLECRSEMCCMWLAENTGHKNDAKNRHLGTITQLCRAISSQLRHVSTIGKKLVKQQYLLHMSPQYGELRPTSGWDRFGSLGHPSYFQWLPRLGSVTAWHSSSGREPNFAALNGGRHLYSTGRP